MEKENRDSKRDINRCTSVKLIMSGFPFPSQLINVLFLCYFVTTNIKKLYITDPKWWNFHRKKRLVNLPASIAYNTSSTTAAECLEILFETFRGLAIEYYENGTCANYSKAATSLSVDFEMETADTVTLAIKKEIVGMYDIFIE